MVANKTSRFAFDWWIIQKRFLYLVIAIFLLFVMGVGAAIYVKIYGNPFRSLVDIKPPSGARFVSFEGDVRVIRAATRETIAASGLLASALALCIHSTSSKHPAAMPPPESMSSAIARTRGSAKARAIWICRTL